MRLYTDKPLGRKPSKFGSYLNLNEDGKLITTTTTTTDKPEAGRRNSKGERGRKKEVEGFKEEACKERVESESKKNYGRTDEKSDTGRDKKPSEKYESWRSEGAIKKTEGFARDRGSFRDRDREPRQEIEDWRQPPRNWRSPSYKVDFPNFPRYTESRWESAAFPRFPERRWEHAPLFPFPEPRWEVFRPPEYKFEYPTIRRRPDYRLENRYDNRSNNRSENKSDNSTGSRNQEYKMESLTILRKKPENATVSHLPEFKLETRTNSRDSPDKSYNTKVFDPPDKKLKIANANDNVENKWDNTTTSHEPVIEFENACAKYKIKDKTVTFADDTKLESFHEICDSGDETQEEYEEYIEEEYDSNNNIPEDDEMEYLEEVDEMNEYEETEEMEQTEEVDTTEEVTEDEEVDPEDPEQSEKLGTVAGIMNKVDEIRSAYFNLSRTVVVLGRNSQGAALKSASEIEANNPIAACLPVLEANGLYICTPCTPRCYIIQKIATSLPTGEDGQGLPPGTSTITVNPNSELFTRYTEFPNGQLSTAPEGNPAGGEYQEGAVGAGPSIFVPQVPELPEWPPVYLPFECDCYAYMNGDVGKLPSGVVYTAAPDPMLSATDFGSLNGVANAVDHYEVKEGAGVVAVGPAVPSPLSLGPHDSNGIPLEQLKQMLLSQLEYYFSRENLANDAYLISQMDNDQYVPIWTVANFNQVKKLTTDIKLITEVLRESPNVQVDEEGQKVRPNHKRCIVILREIPDSTPLEDIKNLFSGEGCPRVISCEFAHNNSWYVTFESDEDAQRAYSFLREEVKVFQGKPIMARIKAKPMNRLPMPPVNVGGLGSMKNGYRTPAAYDPNAGPFQPPPNPGGQQRFLYTNGSSMTPAMNYGNQVHVYQSFQQQPNQPFYPPTMLPWAASNNCYFDIGSVFSVNGLAPQQSFNKPSNNRFVPRPRNNKRPQGNERSSLSDASNTGVSRQHHMPVGVNPATVGVPASVPVVKTVSNVDTEKGMPMVEQNPSRIQPHIHCASVGHVQPHTVNESIESAMASRLSESQDNAFRQNKDKSDANSPGFSADRPRRRRKEDEVTNTSQSQQSLPQPQPQPQAQLQPQPQLQQPQQQQQQQQQSNIRNTSTQVAPGGPTRQNAPSPACSSPQPSSSGQSQSQFDLEATAFPPLPAIEGGNGTVVKTVVVEVVPPAENNAQSHWGENRLADVVKGTVKSKSSNSTKEKDDSPRPASPVPPPQPSISNVAVKPASSGTSAVDVQEKPIRTTQASSQTSRGEQQPTISTSTHSHHMGAGSSLLDIPPTKSDGKEATGSSCDAPVASSSSNILTPPPSPTKCLAVPGAKCATADKSTKTDDILLNGETEKAETQQAAASKPTTTNAATMTSTIAIETEPSVSNTANSIISSNGSQSEFPPRLSYAQVAQHHKERTERHVREKHNPEPEKEKEKEKEKEREKEKDRKKEGNHGREPRERREPAEGFREGANRTSGRGGGARQSQGGQGARRRDGAQSERGARARDMPSRQRSPK